MPVTRLDGAEYTTQLWSDEARRCRMLLRDDLVAAAGTAFPMIADVEEFVPNPLEAKKWESCCEVIAAGPGKLVGGAKGGNANAVALFACIDD